MAQNSTATDDPRPDRMKIEMAQHFEECESEYRDQDWCSIVFENDFVVIVADHRGYEFDEWRSQFGDDFSEMMHDLAKAACDYDWSTDYPVVFDKMEGN